MQVLGLMVVTGGDFDDGIDLADRIDGLPAAAAEDRADGDAEEDEAEDADDVEEGHG